MDYAIYEGFFPDVDKKLTRIAKKCAKLGNPFTYEVKGEEIREVKADNTNTEYYKFILVEVEGTARIDNWEAIAVLEIHESGNIIRNINTNMEVPERFKTSKNLCEHCNSIRPRKNLYVIHNVQTDEWKQVGGDCLAVYTGGLSMEYIARYLDGITELEENNGVVPNGGGKRYYSVHDIISYAQEIIGKIGYFNAESSLPTKCLVAEMVSNVSLDKRIININNMLGKYRINAEFSRTDFYKSDTDEIVQSIIDYYKGLNDDSNFVHNVQVLLSEKYVTCNNIGFLAYLPQGYARHVAKEVERAKKIETFGKSEYFGKIGERYKDEKVTFVERVTSWASDFGITSIYKITLANGAVLMWKTNKELDCEDKFNMITFTVKDHTEYKGQKQTEVTRCKLVAKVA